MTIELDNDKIRRLIPNVVPEVGKETKLSDKLAPWIQSAIKWLEHHLIGEYEPEERLRPLLEKIIVTMAYAEAAPTLDLSLTPSGFAVINTEGRAPASKERVERLISTLRASADALTVTLQGELLKIPEWRESGMGRIYLSTFIPELDHAMPVPTGSDMISNYRAMQREAARFEMELAERFLGRDFMRTLRHQWPQQELPGCAEIYGMVQRAELKYITAHRQDRKNRCPDEHEVWHLGSAILAELRYWPQLQEMWQQEMAIIIEVDPKTVKRKGGIWL